MDRHFWIPALIYFTLPVALFIGRNWLKANIEKSIQHKFDTKIENSPGGTS